LFHVISIVRLPVVRYVSRNRIRMTLLWPGLGALIQRQTSQLIHCMLWFVLALFYLRGISSRTQQC
jgi:hypothetical protein